MANKDVSIKRNDTQNSMLDLAPEFEDLVDRFFGPRFDSMLGQWPLNNTRSMSNIQENDKFYVLTTDVPGIPQEDIEINVNGNLLTVKAERKEEQGAKESDRGYRRQYRSFQQSFSMPTTVDADKIEAHYDNGVLELILPKTEQAQPKKIEVQSGKGSFFDRLVGGGRQTTQDQSSQAKH